MSSQSPVDRWMGVLVCPLDRTPLKLVDRKLTCPTCALVFEAMSIGERSIIDLRAVGQRSQVAATFTIPVEPLDRDMVASRMFIAPNESFDHLSRSEIRQRFGTKLDKGMQFYCQKLLKERGADAPILDLGCGNGGNRAYLEGLGFRNVLSVDWIAKGAHFLADAHRLPLRDGQFAMVISTAVFEHLYNPFLAMSEISRVLDDRGAFVGSASFWEAWHGSSYFHLSPDGWNSVLLHSGMKLVDLWNGWGVLPSLFSHVLTPGYLRGVGYFLQRLVDGGYRLTLGIIGLRRLWLRASGSYQVYAVKTS